jgi:hypothetical protein
VDLPDANSFLYYWIYVVCFYSTKSILLVLPVLALTEVDGISSRFRLLTYIRICCASNECKAVYCSWVDHCGVCSHFL